MNYQDFKKQYRDLEMKVLSSLRDEINKSKTTSEHMDTKSIRINIHGYDELVIVNDRVTFLDYDGNHYSVFADCSLEDLIDILNNINS